MDAYALAIHICSLFNKAGDASYVQAVMEMLEEFEEEAYDEGFFDAKEEGA